MEARAVLDLTLHHHEEQGSSWVDDIPQEEWRAALEAIVTARDAGSVVGLLCHEDPDGDALGSLLAMQLLLRREGFDSHASWGSEPFVVPPQYTFLPGLGSLTPPGQFPRSPDLLVCFDTGSRQRLGSLVDRLDNAGTTLVVDHHQTNNRFGDINLVSPRAAATVVLVDELIRRLGRRPDRDIAACLYTGLVTDTGRFQYRNTDQAAMELGSRLIAEGIEHSEMNRQMFETHSFGYLKVLARALDRATFVPEASLVHSWIAQEDLERFGVALEETEGIIDVLRTADSAETTMILKELEDRRWRVSMRAKGRTDVGALAEEFGGGGHQFSSGFVATGARDDVVAEVVERLAAARG